MRQQELHCLVIRGSVGRYPALVQWLSKSSKHIKVNLIDDDTQKIEDALSNAKLGLIFVFKESGVSIETLAEMTRKKASDAVLVSLNNEEPQSSLAEKSGYEGVQGCNLHYRADSTSILSLTFLIEYALLKAEFRRCKSLLRVSEQRCHWLVDSSAEAVAYIAEDLHLYANQTYLNLFSYDSLHALKVSPVSELVVEDERNVFFDFLLQHDNRIGKVPALVATLQSQNNKKFRASIRLIPTVFSGVRCYQLWIRRLGQKRKSYAHQEIETAAETIAEQQAPLEVLAFHQAEKKAIPWKKTLLPQLSKENTEKHEDVTSEPKDKPQIKKTVHHPPQPKTLERKPESYNKLLKQVLSSREVSLHLAKLDMLNDHDNAYRYIVDLNVPEKEYSTISNILKRKFHDVFWDQVMMALLFQRLKQLGSSQMKLLIPLTQASLHDDFFKQWLQLNISRFKDAFTSCIFLLPLTDEVTKKSDLLHLAQLLDQYTCDIGVDDFVINQSTKRLLKATKAKFVRFSKAWVIANVTTKEKATALAKTIKTLEKNNIRVISPYNSGERLKQLFNISGASFCQKQAVS
ncbi:MAG: EAL domain-containing protein [Cocleimonas sp.]|nr:EAL domain-containing protein [Cocleimonas sp.]